MLSNVVDELALDLSGPEIPSFSLQSVETEATWLKQPRTGGVRLSSHCNQPSWQ